MTIEELFAEKLHVALLAISEAYQLLGELHPGNPEAPARTHAHVFPHALSLVWDSELKKISRFRESKARCLTAFP